MPFAGTGPFAPQRSTTPRIMGFMLQLRPRPGRSVCSAGLGPTRSTRSTSAAALAFWHSNWPVLATGSWESTLHKKCLLSRRQKQPAMVYPAPPSSARTRNTCHTTLAGSTWMSNATCSGHLPIQRQPSRSGVVYCGRLGAGAHRGRLARTRARRLRSVARAPACLWWSPGFRSSRHSARRRFPRGRARATHGRCPVGC
jgi:hypothetical protein